MMNKQQNANWRLGRLYSFLLRVLRGFKRNQGLPLSGAVAYHTLLSIVPLSILASSRFSMRTIKWYGLTNRYRKQLFDLDNKDYLTFKTKEHMNQVVLQQQTATALQ